MRSVLRLGLRAVDLAVVFGLFAAVLGYGLRDRVLALAVLTYAPLVPIALAAIVYDLVRRGRTLGRFRFAMAGAAAGLWGLSDMVGWRPAPPVDPASGARPPLAVVQQNVWWGGGRARSPEVWRAAFERLTTGAPDLLLLSEAPERPWLDPVLVPAGWTYTVGEMPQLTWYRMVVASRWPHRAVQRFEVHEGAALLVVVDRPDAPIRVLMVDGRSWPLRDRPRMLAAIADLLAAQAAAGTPVDIVAGDFNAPARSVGFDAIRADYWLVSRTCGQWRGTWPAWLPLIDVDHLWARKGWTAERCTLVRRPSSDHIGHRAVLR